MAVATNQQYFNAFNKYLEQNNLEQAVTDGKILVGQQVYPVNFDMFFGFLVDKIVMQVVARHSFIDKLDMLYKENLPVGRIIEDVQTILKSNLFNYDTENFEKDVQNPYSKYKKGVSVVYHNHIDRKKITCTVSYEQIKTGCLTEGGVDSIVSTMINDTLVEYSAWAYRAKKELLTDRNWVQTIYFNEYTDFNVLLKNIKIDVTNYDNSYKHNKSALLTPTTADNLIIVMNERFKNFIDVAVFTGLFNVSYAELKDKIVYIDDFIDNEVVCGIYDKRGFYCKRVLDTAKELPNGADLSLNRWLHFWRMHSTSPHFTAVVFKQQPGGFKQNDDMVMLVKGWDTDNDTYIENTEIDLSNTTFAHYSFDDNNYTAFNGNKKVIVTNPKSITPVTLYLKDSLQNEPVIYQVRFEYPAKIDSTLGHNVKE